MTRLFAGTPFDIPPSCDVCQQEQSQCVCTADDKAAWEASRQKAADRLSPEQQKAKVKLEKRKGGRCVTVIDGLTAKANDLPALLSELQTKCGSGGTVKTSEDRIELQGDHQETVRQSLKQIGYKLG